MAFFSSNAQIISLTAVLENVGHGQYFYVRRWTETTPFHHEGCLLPGTEKQLPIPLLAMDAFGEWKFLWVLILFQLRFSSTTPSTIGGGRTYLGL